MDNTPTPTSRPTSSGPPSLSSWHSLAASLAASLTSLAVALAVAIPIGRALPELLVLAGKGQWKPAAAALLALGMVAAPADTLRLVRRYLPGKKE